MKSEIGGILKWGEKKGAAMVPDAGSPQIQTRGTYKTVKTGTSPYDTVQQNEERFCSQIFFDATSTTDQLCDQISLSSIVLSINSFLSFL